MSRQKYIYFQNNEFLDVDGQIEAYPLGQLVFSILDIDWATCLHSSEKLRERLDTMPLSTERTLSAGFEKPDEAVYCIMGDFYQSLVGLFRTDYPCLYRLFSAQNVIKTMAVYEKAYDTADKNKERFDEIRKTGDMLMAADFTVQIFETYPKKPDWLDGYGNIDDSQVVVITLQFVDHLIDSLKSLDVFQNNLLQIIEFALDIDGHYASLTPSQRFYLMQATGFEPYRTCLPLYERLGVKRRLLSDKTPELPSGVAITEETIKLLKDTELSAATFYCSDDVCALALLELEYLCNNNHNVRRCGHCDRYFLPFSQNTRYCDRIADAQRGRTCKDVAAMAKYLSNIREDEAKKLYRRYANTYQMRCSRAPACYPRAEYEAWKDAAKAHMEAHSNGEIDFEKFEELIQIPERR